MVHRRLLSALLLAAFGCTPSPPEAAPEPEPGPPPLTWPVARAALTDAGLRALPPSTQAAVALSPELATATSSSATLLEWTQGLLGTPAFELELTPGAPVLLGLYKDGWFALLPVPDVDRALAGLKGAPLKRVKGVAVSTQTPGLAWLRAHGHLALTPREGAKALREALNAPHADGETLAAQLEGLDFGALAAGFVRPAEPGPIGTTVFGLDLTETHLLAKVHAQTSSAARGGPALELEGLPWTNTATPALFAAVRANPAWVAEAAALALGRERERWDSSLAQPPWAHPAALTGGLVTAWRWRSFGRSVALEADAPQALTATVSRPPSRPQAEGRWAEFGRPQLGRRPLWAGWSDSARQLLPPGGAPVLVVARPAELARPSGLLPDPRGMESALIGTLLLGGSSKAHARVVEQLREVRKERDALQAGLRKVRADAVSTSLKALGYLAGAGDLQGGRVALQGGFTLQGAPQDTLRRVYRTLLASRPPRSTLATLQTLDAEIDGLEGRAGRIGRRELKKMFGSLGTGITGNLLDGFDAEVGIGSGGIGDFSGVRSGGGSIMSGGGSIGTRGGSIGTGAGSIGTGAGGIARLGGGGQRSPRLKVDAPGAQPVLTRFSKRKFGRIQACYRHADGKVEGRLEVKMLVSKGGEVSASSMSGPAAGAVGDCLRRALRGRIDDAPAGPFTVEIHYQR